VKPLNQPRVTVYVAIGNSDDKLPQARWAQFITLVVGLLSDQLLRPLLPGTPPLLHGEWYSLPRSTYQNACFCAEVDQADMPALRNQLAVLAAEFGQDEIALTVVPAGAVEMIQPPSPQRRFQPPQ